MTRDISQFLKRCLLSCFVALFAAMPLSFVLVDTVAADTCTPPDSSQPGVHVPVGSDAALYHYDCDQGLWVSAHYTYNPATGVTKPIEPIVYTYNPSTDSYDTQAWVYNAPQGDYVLVGTSVVDPPAGANVASWRPAPPNESSISDTGEGSTNTIDNNGSGNGGKSISNTGANSNNGISGGGNNTLNTTNGNQISLGNVIVGQANSGNAIVIGNTTAGDATSGDAQDVANIINLLQSTSSALGSGNVVAFVANIDGDVNGDLLFDPATLSQVQPNISPNDNNNLTLNNSTDASIINDIDLSARSGDVTVSENTTAGNATSGQAQAIANVLNIINSAIGSGKSFVGTININGNLNGDILVPPDLVEQLIASNVPTVTITNTGADSTNTITNKGGSNTNVKNTNTNNITNNVNASAQSGDANVSENTTAGNGTSGQAATSITAFNLTGSNAVGKNSILVFVNVMGKWVGMIVNAPPGATAAALGGGISNTGADSNNSASDNGTTNTNIDNTGKQTITNNINVAARSGDANVTRNTNAGDAKSGDAKTAVNLLNVENSTLSLSNWFGILFINVFGVWNGSFGINTAAGDPILALPGSFNATNGDPTNGGAGAASGPPQVFRFVPKAGADNTFNLAPAATTTGGAGGGGNNAILAAAHNVLPARITTSIPGTQTPHNSFTRVAVIVGAFTGFIIISDALYTRRHPQRA